MLAQSLMSLLTIALVAARGQYPELIALSCHRVSAIMSERCALAYGAAYGWVTTCD